MPGHCVPQPGQEALLWGPRGGRATGPVHLRLSDGLSQAWCGSRAQFRHRWFRGSVEDVTCSRCLSAIKKGSPWARGS